MRRAWRHSPRTFTLIARKEGKEKLKSGEEFRESVGSWRENNSWMNETVSIQEVIDGPCADVEKEVDDTEVGTITRRIVLESFEARTRGNGRRTMYREKHGCASTSALSCEPASRARRADVQRRVVCWWKQIGQLGATRPRQAE